MNNYWLDKKYELTDEELEAIEAYFALMETEQREQIEQKEIDGLSE